MISAFAFTTARIAVTAESHARGYCWKPLGIGNWTCTKASWWGTAGVTSMPGGPPAAEQYSSITPTGNRCVALLIGAFSRCQRRSIGFYTEPTEKGRNDEGRL